MPDRKNQSNLGEQVNTSDEAANLGAQERSGRSSMNESTEQGSRSGVRGSQRSSGEGQADRGASERINARPSTAGKTDRTSGDEGLDSVEHLREDSGTGTQRGSSSGNVGAEPGSFSGRGAQRGASEREAEGTGYTGDRSSQIQDDSSLGGSQGRHGSSGARQGKPRTGTSDAERQGGQTAQNPRKPGSSDSSSASDDIDRSVM